MKTQIHSFRVEHRKSKLGIFNHDRVKPAIEFEEIIWDYEFLRSEVDEILENFKNIPSLLRDFLDNFPDEVGNETEYKCAFNSLEDLFSVLPLHLLEFIFGFNFQIVKVVGIGLKSPKQTFFKEEEVKIKPVNVHKLLNTLAKKEAKKHIGKSLNVKNYIIDGFWDF